MGLKEVIEKFKTYSSWLRFGTILGGLFFLITIFEFSAFCRVGMNFDEPCGFFMQIFTFPLLSFSESFNFTGPQFYFLSFFIGLISYFIIGAILGLIIEKVKNRNN